MVNDLKPVRDTLESNLRWKAAYDELEAAILFESTWGDFKLVAGRLPQ